MFVYKLISIVFVVQLALQTIADVQVEIKVLNYKNLDNKYKRQLNGSSFSDFIYCCGDETAYNNNKVCEQLCDPSLEIKARDNSDGQVMGTWDTGSLGYNKTINFKNESKIGNLTNPFIFNLPFWNNQYLLILNLYDGDKKDHVMSQVSLGLVNVSSDEGSAETNDVNLYNHHHQLSLQIKLFFVCKVFPDKHTVCPTNSKTHTCAPNYYGKYCTKYCVTPHNSRGHCNHNGSLICNPQFYGLNCSNTCIQYRNDSHGQCDGNGTLICDRNYYGSHCEIFCIDTEHGTCDEYGNLICRQHYYGLNCTTYCAPTQHGNCTKEGKLTCAYGYTGNLCDSVINFCRETSCNQHGTCSSVVGGYNCTCMSGWQGDTCGVNVNECQNDVCKNGGHCLYSLGSLKCNCLSGWIGSDCNIDKNECNQTTPICKNDATCKNSPGGYTCTCKRGWKGLTCQTDIDECSYDICGVGNCTNTFGGYKCMGVQDGSIKLVFKNILTKSEIQQILSGVNVASQVICSKAVVDAKLYSLTTNNNITTFSIPVTCNGNPLLYKDLKDTLNNMADIFPDSLVRTEKNDAKIISQEEKSWVERNLMTIIISVVVVLVLVVLLIVVLVTRRLLKKRKDQTRNGEVLGAQALCKENPLYNLKFKSGDTLV